MINDPLQFPLFYIVWKKLCHILNIQSWIILVELCKLDTIADGAGLWFIIGDGGRLKYTSFHFLVPVFFSHSFVFIFYLVDITILLPPLGSEDGAAKPPTPPPLPLFIAD